MDRGPLGAIVGQSDREFSNQQKSVETLGKESTVQGVFRQQYRWTTN